MSVTAPLIPIQSGNGGGAAVLVPLLFLAIIFWPLLGFGDYEYGGAPA